MRAVEPLPAASPRVLASDGSVQNSRSAYEYIADYRLEGLTESLGWAPQQLDPPSFEGRKEQLQDMLSVFDPKGVLPEEYRRSAFQNLTEASLTGQECYVPGELEHTLIKLAMNDDAVFRALRETVTPSRCAHIYIQKLRSRAISVIKQLDQYVSEGPSDENQEPTDIRWCAKHLRALVSKTSEGLNLRAPLPAEVYTRAATFLAELLQSVCNRNHDVFEDIDWDRTASRDENEADRNLYVYLIGDPQNPSAQQDNFVIDVLRDFPPASISQLTERLEGVLETVQQNGAPEGYIQALGDLIERLEGAAASSVSGQKRRRVG